MSLAFLDGRRLVLAPMAGGPGTPELAAAVAEAGGLPFLPSGYQPVAALAAGMQAFRSLSDVPVAVNVFVPAAPDAERLRLSQEYAGVAGQWAEAHGLPVGEPRYDDDSYEAKLDLLVERRPAAVSFTFGLPDRDVVRRLAEHGVAILVTVTTPAEAAAAEERGADGLVVQGAEAGSHRGGWLGGDEEPEDLVPLLGAVRDATDLPVLAAGGIATGRDLAAVLDAGAVAAVLGTAFLLAPEAGTSPIHREALGGDRRTVLTRAFTGKRARALVNRFTEAMADEAPDAYPEVHHVTAAMRASARERGDPEAVNLWAGQGYRHTRPAPAGDTVRRLLAEAGLRSGT
jgi:nitronate monooxygenase